MSARLIRRRYDYVRVDLLSVIVYPILALALAVMAGKFILATGLVKSIYASPFVALSALIANRVCLRAGLLTAALSVITHEFFFAAPYHQLNWPTQEQALAYAANFLAAYAVARRVPMPPPRGPSSLGAHGLPFAVIPAADAPRVFWVAESDGDWVRDADVGQEYGRIYLEQMRAGYAPPLGWIIRDMIAAGRYGGVEAGFCSTVALALVPSRLDHHADKH